MTPNAELLRFLEGQGHPVTIIFIALLSLAILTASAFGLLRPWPPDFFDGLMFIAVAVICLGFGGGVVWSGARLREVRIDRSASEVTELVRFVGLGRTKRWKLGDFHSAQVEQIKIRDRAEEARSRQPGAARVATGPDFIYVLDLVGPSGRLRLQSWTENFSAPQAAVLEAEAQAVKVARFGGWQAKRRNYRIAVSDGVAITTAEGAESIIEPRP
jgi:hypothetical protein